MTLALENLRVSSKTVLDLIRKLGNVADYKENFKSQYLLKLFYQ